MKILNAFRKWNAKRVLNKYLIHFLWQDTETFEDVLAKFNYEQLQKMQVGQGNHNLKAQIVMCGCVSGPISESGKIPNPKMV